MANKKSGVEQAKKELQTELNRSVNKVKKIIKADIKSSGIRSVKLKLEFLKENPNTMLPSPDLGYNDTVTAFESVIAAYETDLEIKRSIRRIASGNA